MGYIGSEKRQKGEEKGKKEGETKEGRRKMGLVVKEQEV
jgi:hypothetical protein